MIKTSATHPLRVDFIGQSVLGSRGALGMTLAPGKRGPSLFGGRWERDLDADLARAGQEHGATVLVSLLGRDEAHRLGIRGYASAARRHGIRLLRQPLPGTGIPTLSVMSRLVGEINDCLDRGERVVMHGRGGRGRTGTATACVLVRRGLSAEAAIQTVRAARPGAIENDSQASFVKLFASRSETVYVSAWLRDLQPGLPWQAGGLQIVPLSLPREAGDPGCRLAGEAFADGSLEVIEQGGGVVQELKARNRGSVPVLILEGDTLVGCKQNRVVTQTMLLAPKATGVVHVGCMEQNRWNFVSSRFQSGTMRMEPAVRRENLRERVSGSSRQRFDQGRLWQQVADRLESSEVASTTADYDSYLRARAGDVQAMVKDFVETPGQVGALVVRGGRLVALEAAGHPRLWRALSRRTLVSYLLEDAATDGGGSEDPQSWLARIAKGSVTSSPGLGLGWDFTVRGAGFVGSGLFCDRALAHVAVFGTV